MIGKPAIFEACLAPLIPIIFLLVQNDRQICSYGVLKYAKTMQMGLLMDMMIKKGRGNEKEI